jgi:hypothetical protein
MLVPDHADELLVFGLLRCDFAERENRCEQLAIAVPSVQWD